MSLTLLQKSYNQRDTETDGHSNTVQKMNNELCYLKWSSHSLKLSKGQLGLTGYVED